MTISRYCILVFTLFFSQTLSAQQKSGLVGISVFVIDASNDQVIDKRLHPSFWHNYMKDADVSFLSEDSTLLAKGKPVQLRDTRVYRYDALLIRSDAYIIKVEREGFETAWQKVSVKKGEKSVYAGEMLLYRKPLQLDEVTVVGSKVLMVNRGDTIVYNASALQLSNGSMLDALIRRLPGVELHPGGRITVNGKYVESLLVNGRDFFRGDPKVALENLPAYYVDNVKVYHKTSLWRQVMYGDSVKASTQEDPYVMDVRLKRDYAEGWLANGEAGYGTEDRWLARLFGMRYTRHTGFFVYGNANNLNNDQTAGSSGRWTGRAADEGTIRTRTAGINFSGDDSKRHLEYSTSAKLQMTDGDYEDVTSADNYYATGNIWQRSSSRRSTERTDFSWEGRLNYGTPHKFTANVSPRLSYQKTNGSTTLRSASFQAEPPERYLGESLDSLYAPGGSQRLLASLVNSHRLQTLFSSDDVRLGGDAFVSFPVFSKWLSLSFAGEYISAHQKEHDIEELAYSNMATKHLNRYAERPSASYNYTLMLSYKLLEETGDGLGLRMGCRFRQQYKEGERQLYQLHLYDRYTNGSTAVLPSTLDSLEAVIDIRNSYRSVSMCRSFQLSADFNIRFFQVSIPVTLTNDRMNDSRKSGPGDIRRREIKFDPFVLYYKNGYLAQYKYEQWLPDMNYLADVRDDADPQWISLGNAGLRRTGYHKLTVGYKPRRIKGDVIFNVEQNLDLSTNSIAMSRRYDLKTGVTTLRPENINGNWSMWGSIAYSRPVRKGSRLRLGTTTSYRYHHSVDYSSIDTQPTSVRSMVRNLTLDETLKTSYQSSGWSATATAHAAWRRAASPIETFVPISAWDYNYGVKLTKLLLKTLDLETELMMWSRRGYSDHSMNDDCLIWNATLSYSFGRLKQWVLKVEGTDMLRQRSNVRHTMNAQGRSETWYRTIPSYWMLRIAYQFKKEPKKKGLGTVGTS